MHPPPCKGLPSCSVGLLHGPDNMDLLLAPEPLLRATHVLSLVQCCWVFGGDQGQHQQNFQARPCSRFGVMPRAAQEANFSCPLIHHFSPTHLRFGTRPPSTSLGILAQFFPCHHPELQFPGRSLSLRHLPSSCQQYGGVSGCACSHCSALPCPAPMSWSLVSSPSGGPGPALEPNIASAGT